MAELPEPVATITASHVRLGSRNGVSRSLPEEIPVAMVYDGTSHAVMMVTPADIQDFAAGFSLTEGFVTGLEDIASCDVIAHDLGVEARMWLRGGHAEALAARRRNMIGPVGCGLCGIDSLEEASRTLPEVPSTGLSLSVSQMALATESLRDWQPFHDRTRAVHAAGFLIPGRGIVLAREDVGRHNALDKLIGAMARQDLDAKQGAIVLTSRVSVEMVQKCAMAGCAVLIAVSAPTLHALRIADAAGITVAAFARGEGFDLFTHPERLKAEVSHVA